ncbi:MAG: flavin reductase, partial [Eubacterium sp.]
MKKWRCIVCGYIHEGDTPPEKCPICGVGPDKFELVEEVSKPKKWRCIVCG